ncbi:hypothetical protein [Sorangium sp. So ce1153]|uniref:hypothetical protein n=1 Tax=Sorangium sp. So ce1153 TaxID=3133333 RepID=UPI003F6015BC
MDHLLTVGVLFLTTFAETLIMEEVRSEERAHRQRLAAQLQREHTRLVAQRAARAREGRAALERLRLASSDPRWQEQIDLLLAKMTTG